MSLEFRFQSASTDYQKIQTELASFVDSRTRLDAQLSENEMVKKVRQRLIRIRSASPVLISSRSLHN
jgi:prefoldin beta subunit